MMRTNGPIRPGVGQPMGSPQVLRMARTFRSTQHPGQGQPGNAVRFGGLGQIYRTIFRKLGMVVQGKFESTFHDEIKQYEIEQNERMLIKEMERARGMTADIQGRMYELDKRRIALKEKLNGQHEKMVLLDQAAKKAAEKEDKEAAIKLQDMIKRIAQDAQETEGMLAELDSQSQSIAKVGKEAQNRCEDMMGKVKQTMDMAKSVRDMAKMKAVMQELEQVSGRNGMLGGIKDELGAVALERKLATARRKADELAEFQADRAMRKAEESITSDSPANSLRPVREQQATLELQPRKEAASRPVVYAKDAVGLLAQKLAEAAKAKQDSITNPSKVKEEEKENTVGAEGTTQAAQPQPSISSPDETAAAQVAMMGLIGEFRDFNARRRPGDTDVLRFVETAIRLQDEPLSKALATTHNRMTDLLRAVNGESTTQVEARTGGLLEAMNQITHEGLRTEWVRALAENKTEPQVRRTAVKSCNAVADPAIKDRIIYQACTDSSPTVQDAGFGMLINLTNRSLFRQVAKKFPEQAGHVMEMEMEQQTRRMTDEMRRLYKENPTIRRALDETFGGEDHLPTPTDITGQFQTIAHQYLKGQQAWYQRLFGRRIPREQLLEMRYFLTQVASETGSYMAVGIKPEHIPIIKQVYDKRVETETKLTQARALYADQLIIKAQTDQAVTTQQAEVNRTKLAFVKAGETKETDKPGFDKAYEAYKAAQTALKDAEEKQGSCDTTTQVADYHIKQLVTQLNLHHTKLTRAIYGSVTGANREELKALLDSSDDLMQDASTRQAVENAELHEARGEAERQDIASRDPVGLLKTKYAADLGLEQLQSATPQRKPLSATAR